MRLSIRWRLTLWITLALAGVLLGFSALVYGIMAHALYEQVDRALALEFEQLRHDERLAGDPAGRLRYWIDEFQEHEKHFCVAYDAQGQVLARTAELPAVSIPPQPPVPSAGPARSGTVTLPGIGRQRILSGHVRAGGEEFRILHLAPLGEVDHELGHLVTGLSLAVPVALILSGGLAYLLARKALAPMDQLHRSTEQITADRLDRRLPLLNPHDELG